jgi:LAO/AO transport system kinase
VYVQQLIEECLQGNRHALPRLISLVENNDPQRYDILKRLYPHTGKAFVIGITGTPGAGKSTLVARLLHKIRREGLTVGVIVVDPTSPFTGGAILGDRIRMQEHAIDDGVFIRSMGTRGSLGGLSQATRQAIQVLDAFGKDLILVETVGVGQSEVDIVKTADTTVVVLTPGGGDSVQTIKAGIMEIADVFVINKADLPGAEQTSTEVNIMLDMKGNSKWRPPVVLTVSTREERISEFWDALQEHRRFLEESNRLLEVRKARVRLELAEQVEYLVKSQAFEKIKERISLEEVVEEIALRRQDPYSAAWDLLKQIDFSFPEV